MPDLRTNKAIALRLIEVFNGRRLDLLEEVLHPEFRGRGISAFAPDDPEVGPGARRKLYEMFLQAIPDARGEVLDIVAEGDKVVLVDRFGGTHRGEFLGRPGTGDRIEWMAIHIYTVRDGKVLEDAYMRDELAIMQQLGLAPSLTKVAPWSLIHPLSEQDSAAVAALRSVVAPMKGKFAGTAGRGPFNDIMERVAVPEAVTFEAATVGGISGWWARPPKTQADAAIIHVHGGWFNLGSAGAFRNFAGHIALSAGADVFIPEYRLAPEHPFPAAVRDLETCYRGLFDNGITRIALTGDSAGGNLALVLLSIASGQASKDAVTPVGAVVFSPITDLALTGESFDTRAEADPFFTKSQAAGLVRSYLGNTNPRNPLASPLYGDLSGLPPIRVLVGDEEVLLDDSRRYVERAVAAGVDAKLDIWMGMPHGFVTGVGKFNAATQAFSAVGAFLIERLERTSR